MSSPLKVTHLILVFVLTVLLFGWLSTYGLDAHHDGVMLKPALDVASGQTLFKDTFSQYGPIATWFQALGINLFGPHLLTIRLTTVFFYGLTAIAIFIMGNILLPPLLNWLSFLIWLNLASFFEPTVAFMPWSSAYAILFQILGGLALHKLFLKTDAPTSNRQLFLLAVTAGVAAALVFWIRQPVGILTTAAFFVVALGFGFFNLRKSLLITSSMLLGCLIVCGTIVAHLYAHDSLLFWWQQNIVWPIKWSGTSGGNNLHGTIFCLFRRRNEMLVLLAVILLARPLLRLVTVKGKAWQKWVLTFLIAMVLFFRFPKTVYQSAIFTVMPIATLLTAWIIFRKKAWLSSGRAFSLITLTGLSLASWVQFYPIPDSRHVYWAISPVIAFFVYILYEWLNKEIKVVALMLGIWLVSVSLTHWLDLRAKFAYNPLRIDHQIFAGITAPQEAKGLEPIIKGINQTFEKLGPRPIVLESRDMLWATLTPRLENAHRVSVIWQYTGLGETHFDEQGLAFIQKYRPIIISQFNQPLPTKLAQYKLLVQSTFGLPIYLWTPSN